MEKDSESEWVWDELDRSYEEAMCNPPHGDGSLCIPTYDGFVYTCEWKKLTLKGE